ncbi:hypothetical protein V6N13_088979 [Hibiscus sabdariffa]|uniref:Uncharacterized protein n=1 Tax=Hibiscus sabdariffa TaxID=183260 RepID=A0ABR2G117_9ROSI
MCAFVDDANADFNWEKKKRHRLEIVNSKLVNELVVVKLSTNQYMQNYEKERKARELIEEVCDELAKEIGEDKVEIWREERVQMKLIDAKTDEIEEDESGRETVSHFEDQGSSDSAEESVENVNKNCMDNNFSGNGTEWEGNAYGDTPNTEISEVCSYPARQSKKVSSIARFWTN